MSKYTTQVRFICENKSGLEVSGYSSDVDNIIAGSWNKIFTSKAPFFDEAYRSVLCSKILKHYYMREICCETVGIWTLWMNTRLEEIMPYYNQLYESELLKFNPLATTSLKTTRVVDRKETEKSTNDLEHNATSRAETNVAEGNTFNGNVTSGNSNDVKGDSTTQTTDSSTGSTNVDSTNTTSNNSTVTVNDTKTSDISRDKYDKYSDTPQGSLKNVKNDTYLTNARNIIDTDKVTDKTNGTTKDDSDSTTTEDSYTKVESKVSGSASTTYNEAQTSNGAETTINESKRDGTTSTDGNEHRAETSSHDRNASSLDDYLEMVEGNSGKSLASLLNEFRSTFLNIDAMIIDEFSDLFMLLW